MAGKGFRPELIAKQRADFLRTKEGRRYGLPGLAIETCRTPDVLAAPGLIRVGFTATKRLGGAVERNRAKRRLRALAQRVLTLSGREGHDYVLIARPGTLSRRFGELESDLKTAIAAVHAAFDRDNRISRNDAQFTG
jgi:ribonuclease P protein component